MKNLILLLTLAFSASAGADQVAVTVPVPAGATTIVLKAKGVPTDSCNGFGLSVREGFGATEGYFVGVMGTEMACMDPEPVYQDVEGEVAIVEPKAKATFIFQTYTIKDLEIDFK